MSVSRRGSETTRVAWIASAYGFGPDLAYYRQVFAEFVRRFPQTVIHVDKAYPVAAYPDLPLQPDFSFFVLERHRTIGDGIPYVGRLRLPTPRTVLSILRDRAQVFLVIEFTPVALLGWFIGRLRRRRVLLLVECDPAFRGATPSKTVMQVKRWVARTSHAVLTSNEHGRRYVRDELRLPDDKILVGPYLTSDPGVAEPSGSSTRVRLLFLNTISQRKGIIQLIEALALLPQDLQDRWTLTIVGSGDQEKAVAALIEDHGWSEKVEMCGRVPHSSTPAYFAAADVVVCPTLGDYRSLSGIEAVNAGKGVIVSVHDGAAAEILQHSPAAWEVDPTDVEGFARTLSQLLSDEPTLAARLSAARQPPRAFSLEVVGDSLQAAVERAME